MTCDSGQARRLTARRSVRLERGTKFALDSLLERDGFEPSVPRQKDLCKHPRLPAIASAGGADRREHGENADLAPSREELPAPLCFRHRTMRGS